MGALDGFLVSDLGCFLGFGRVIAGGHGMLDAGGVRAFVALLGGGPVALGGSFMVVGGGDVGIFWQGGTTFQWEGWPKGKKIGSRDLVQTIREWAEALRHLYSTLSFVYVKHVCHATSLTSQADYGQYRRPPRVRPSAATATTTTTRPPHQLRLRLRRNVAFPGWEAPDWMNPTLWQSRSLPNLRLAVRCTTTVDP